MPGKESLAILVIVNEKNMLLTFSLLLFDNLIIKNLPFFLIFTTYKQDAISEKEI
jgi:hypothetical protein